MGKLTNNYTINLDDETAETLAHLARVYQRKPAELLRLLVVPAITTQFLKLQEETHPENKSKPQKAIFKGVEL